MNALMQKLNLSSVNLGVCAGPDGWLKSSASPITVFNPATNTAIADVIPADRATYDAVTSHAKASFKTWRNMPAPKRGDVVRDLGNLLRQYKEPLGELVSLEMGKIRVEGLGEVQEMIDICDFAVGLSRQLYGLTMHSERPGHRMYEQWHPLGPIGIITAFNFPVAVWSWNAALGAVCGDTMIWKPSELTPLTAVATQHLCNKVMADYGLSGVFTLAVGGREIGEWLTNDTELPMISFTGSIATGRKVAQTVASRLGRTILELGGNNAIIVTENADLNLVSRAVVFGAVGTAGQRCTTTRRLIVHNSMVATLIERLVKAYKTVPIGNPLDSKTLVGPLVTATAVKRMTQAIERAVADGGKVVVGGKARPDIGPNFVEPTIILMPTQTEIVREETFAPILYVMTYEGSVDNAIAMQNNVTQGLSSAIFSDSVRQVEQFLSVSGSDCGIANVNIGTSGAEIGGAFGGEKDTGGGRESGSDAWKGYMRRQTNTINYSSVLPLAQGIEFGE
jgi:aldehyde dehydrogenase (NAD+)